MLTNRVSSPAGLPGTNFPVIDPKAVFNLQQARSTLQLAKNCLPREIRLGRLRVAKRAGKYFILGAWLLEWIEGGEVTRQKKETAAESKGFEENAIS